MSHPSQVVLPFPRWEPKDKPVKEDDVGPQVTHIYEVNALLCIERKRMCRVCCDEEGKTCIQRCGSIGLCGFVCVVVGQKTCLLYMRPVKIKRVWKVVN